MLTRPYTACFRLALALLCPCFFLSAAWSAPQVPPAPKQHFNDYAGVVSADVVAKLNQQLEAFDRATSTQVVVAVFRRLPANTTLEEFAVRTFEQWGIGQRGKDNGAALFVFIDDRRMRIEVGYGLEGLIPDAIANRIINEQIAPAFRDGQYDLGMVAGVNAMLRALGADASAIPVASPRSAPRKAPIPPFLFVILLLFILLSPMFRRRGTVYHHRRRRHYGGWGTSTWGGGWGGGGWSGGGGFSGGFSGGGGRSGGGGASGGW